MIKLTADPDPVYNVNALPTVIEAGHQGDNEAQTIDFDITDWRNRYGAGNVIIYFRINGMPYSRQLQQIGTIARLTITSDLTEYAGFLEAQLRYTVNNNVVKHSKMFMLRIADSL